MSTPISAATTIAARKAADEAELERHQRGVAREGRERVDAAMREVEHPACREDQREAERDQRIDAAGDDAVDGKLGEHAHGFAPAINRVPQRSDALDDHLDVVADLHRRRCREARR